MEAPLLVNLPQMIDLALGIPDNGTVNFNILHALLHVITTHLNLNNSHIEIHGQQAQKVKKIIATLPIEPTINLTAYEIETKGDERVISKRQFPQENEVLIVVKGFGDEDVAPYNDYSGETAGTYQKTSNGKRNNGNNGRPSNENIRGNNNNIKSTNNNNQSPNNENNQHSDDYNNTNNDENNLPDLPTSIVSLEDYKKLEKKVDSINDLMSVALPDKYETENPDGTVNTLNERLNKNEKKIAKIAEVSKNLIGKFNDLKEEFSNIKNNTLADLLDRMDETTKLLYDNNIMAGDLNIRTDKKQTNSLSDSKSTVETSSIREIVTSTDKQEQSTADDANRTGGSGGVRDEGGISDAIGVNNTGGSTSTGVATGASNKQSVPESKAGNGDLLSIINEIEAIKATLETLKNPIRGSPENLSAQAIGHDSEQSSLEVSENRSVPQSSSDAKYFQRQTERKIEIIESKMDTLERQIFIMEKEISDISEKIEDFVKDSDPEGKPDNIGVADVYNDLSALKKEFISLKAVLDEATKTSNGLNETVEAFKEKIEELENDKVNKEEIDELLADKADYHLLQGKVSVDQFDAVRKEWGDSLIDAKLKLNEQETFWQETIKDIQSMLDSKLNKEELSPLKEHINKKLQAVQERLKALAALRRDPEAAGCKTRFLRDVNCLSCERDVIMRMEDTASVPKPDLLPPTKSLKPFLTYELDNVRKQINNLGNSRNMHHFEDITRDDYVPPKRNEKEHLCSRFCGGSHTTLSPYDRFVKTHFERNKKDVSHDADYYIKGNDGTMYKGTMPSCKCEKPTDKEIQVIEEVKQITSGKSSKNDIIKK